MQKLNQRRALGVLVVVLASQALTACVVVPVPRHRPIVVQPGYSGPPPHHRHGHHDRHHHDHRRDTQRGPAWRR